MIAVVLMSEEEVAALGRNRVEDSGFGALRCERGLLPLAAMDVDARVAGVMASIEVAQTFVNTTGVAIEATYMFPLPDRAAVNRFRMEVAGRVIEGVVDERGHAREQYDQAIAAGQRAAITEEERAGVFTLRVGNLMPGEAATIRLSLVGPLPIDDGEVTFRFPLVVAPRYMPGYGLGGEQAGLGVAADTNLVPDASRISPPVLLPGMRNPVRLSIRVALADGQVRDVASSLHAVTTSVRDAQVIELAGAERLDRDFVLRWRVDGAELRSELVCADDADGRGGTFMLTVVPPSTLALSQKPRDVVFVIDRSGSMEGWKMVAARRACARMIDTLTSRDRFCVLAFDNVVEMIPEAQVEYATDRLRFRAVEGLAKIEARGGTELAGPLASAVNMLAGGHDDRERVVVLLTDGQVGNEDQILAMVAPNLRNVRMFTLGIDQAVNGAFLRRLAGAGGGLCELVESEDRLDAVMGKVHRRIGTPVASELHLNATGMDVVWTSVAPARLPDVYAGAPVVILGRYRGTAASDASLTIDGTSFGDPLKLRIARDIEGAAGMTGTVLGASWARAHIRDLEDKYAAGSRELEGEIVRVSKQWNVLSKFTAFLAIDPAVVNPGGLRVPVVQPVESPAGWGAEAKKSVGGAMNVRRTTMVAGRGGASNAYASPPPPPGGAAVMPQGAPQAEEQERAKSRNAPMNPGMRSAPPSPGYSAQPPAPRLPAGPGAGPSRPPSSRPPAAPRPSPAPMSPPPKMVKREADERAVADKSAGVGDASAYLAKLSMLARDLEAEARGAASAGKLRLIRQRLREWAEDLRSVGGFDALAGAVDQLVHRLGDAITNSSESNELVSIAQELARLATGTTPSAPRPSGRPAFWK